MTGGEQWAAAELDRLRAAGFRPNAWWRFLDESFGKAAEARLARPALARQARLWSASGLCAGIVACRSRRVRSPRCSRFALWWIVTAAMLHWHLGMLEGPAGEPRDRLSPADALTLLRVWSVPFIATQQTGPPFAAMIAAAGASDALDGILARRAGPTRLGRDLDTVADAMTTVAAACAARRAGWLPAGAALLVTARSAAPIAVVAATYFGTGQRPGADAVGTTRPLAPLLLAGLAASPIQPRAGAALTGAASLASLAVAWNTRSTS
jgi:phosphatidylglycerophosphate synthase